MQNQPQLISRPWWLVGVSVIAALLAYAILAGQLAPAVLAATIAIAAVFSRVIGWFAGTVAGLLSSLVLAQLVSSLSYLTPSFNMSDQVRWVLTCASVIAIWFARNQTIRPGRIGAIAALLALFPAALTGTAFALTGSFSGERLGWMLSNDAPFNSLMVRRMVESNGADPAFADVPSLAQQLMALAVSDLHLQLDVPGAAFVTMLSAQAQALVVLWLLCSPILGMIAFREFGDVAVAWRLLAVVGGAMYPLSWFLMGASLGYGFFNVPIALLGLGIAWAIWRFPADTPLSKAFRAGLLWLSAVLMMGAWVPLAVVPVALAIAATAALWKIRMSGWRVWAPLGVGVAAVGVYAVAVVVPSYLKFGSSLAANGAMVNFGPYTFVLVLSLAVLATTLGLKRWWVIGSFPTGLAILCLASAAGLAVLLLSARAWTYYPAKFAWILAFFILFLTVLTLLRMLIGRSELNWNVRLVSGLATIGIAGSLLMSVPPSTGGWLPFVGIARSGVGDSGAVAELSAVLGTKTVWLTGEQPSSLESTVNSWSLQWDAHTSRDPIRSFAYGPVTVENVCNLATVWGGGVSVRHADQTARDALAGCAAITAVD